MATIARHRGFRFRFPDLDPGRSRQWGLSREPESGGLMVDGDDNIRQAIRMIISTTPGERVMRPAYGCDLRKLAFEPNDDTTAGLAIHYVRRALTRWEPRIELLRVDARPAGPGDRNRDADGSGEASARDLGWLRIEVDYRVRRTQRSDRIVMSVSLTGDES